MGRLQKKKSPEKKKKTKKKSTGGGEEQRAVANEQAAGSVQAAGKRVAKAATGVVKKAAPSAPTPEMKPKENVFGRAIQFLREVKIELKKVTWPSRKQTIGSTIVVIALVMIISLFLGVVDLGLSSLIRVVLQ
jgi:preprotein translocase subunit SecE